MGSGFLRLATQDITIFFKEFSAMQLRGCVRIRRISIWPKTLLNIEILDLELGCIYACRTIKMAKK
jgi:hypothetical protein